jgi:glycerate dehydrogenase
MRVLISERKHANQAREGRTSFAETLQQSDVLSLHCPLTEETRDLISGAELARMKPTALLINTARGALIDDAALIEALRSGRIAGAGLDALREEPPRQGNPLLDLDLPNLIVTPHVAWASNEAVQALADQVIENMEAFVAGRPKNILT